MPRIINDEEIEYKEKKVTGLLDRVTAKLTGKKSEIFTKLAKRYKEIDNAIKILGEEREALNEKVKTHMVEMFDAEDEVLTRVIESVSLTATLSKRTPESTKSVESFDTEGFITQLYNELPELENQLNELVKRFKVVREVTVAEKSPALRVKIEEDEDMDQNLLNKIEEYSGLVYAKISKNLMEYDRKILPIINAVM
jgi:type IV secretory pathway VirB4 component